MPNGMSKDPIEIQGFRHYQTVHEGRVTSTHLVPVEQFVHYISLEADCLCGPDVEYLPADDGRVVAQVNHYALDPAYYGFRDWGPDGPEGPEVLI